MNCWINAKAASASRIQSDEMKYFKRMRTLQVGREATWRHKKSTLSVTTWYKAISDS
jgi:hypothetical protein